MKILLAIGRGAVVPNPSVACGEQRADAMGPTGILHDDTAESYVIISGSATLITGGAIVNGRHSAPDNEVTTILNGPSCSGTMMGYTSRDVKTGEIVIPEGVPHGFSAIPDHVTYLSMRPDLKKVLQHGYVNPALNK
jgi:quercetin dioxygenase-like cupin family protein